MKNRCILHVITTVNPGGAENHLSDLVGYQSRAGMEVTVAYLRNEWRDLGVAAHDLDLHFYGDVGPLLKLRRLIQRLAPDLVHAHLPPAELYVRLALMGIPRERIPLLITKHNDERFCKAPGQRLLGRWVAKRAEAVIAISDSVKRYVIGAPLGLPVSKVQTIHYGIDVARFRETGDENGREVRRRWGVSESTMLVGFVGRFVFQKSIETLLEGFAQFLQDSGMEAQLALVGKGELENQLRARAKQLGIAHRVIWPGFQNEVSGVMRAFDVLAITSRYEGFGLVIAEAMASARPVIGTRVSAIPELVEDGKTGLLVPPADPASVALALARLADPDFRRDLGRAGQQRVQTEFHLDRMCERTDELYRRLMPSFSPKRIRETRIETMG